MSLASFFSHFVHFKYFNVDGCHTLEFIINCERSLGRFWKIDLMTSGMKGVMLGMLTNDVTCHLSAASPALINFS